MMPMLSSPVGKPPALKKARAVGPFCCGAPKIEPSSTFAAYISAEAIPMMEIPVPTSKNNSPVAAL